MTEQTRESGGYDRVDGTAFGRIMAHVMDERARQEVKFGDRGQSCANPAMPPLLSLAVLLEEVGEVARALIDGEGIDGWRVAVREELVQVAAVAVAWIEGLDGGVT